MGGEICPCPNKIMTEFKTYPTWFKVVILILSIAALYLTGLELGLLGKLLRVIGEYNG